MPITVFLNKDGYFNEKNKIEIPNSSGFWNCITSSDIDNDGDEDYVLGNLGTNSRMKASAKEPLYLYKEDYDKNGSNDPLIGQFYENKKGERKLYPLHTRDDIIKQLPMIKNRYVQYAAFGEVTLSELLEADLNSDAFLKIDQTQSCMLINEGGGKSSLKILPTAAQTAPIQSILIKDINQDGHPDLIMVGNDFTSEKNNGWYDAFNGLILLGDGKGTFKELPAAQSNFIVSKDARDIIQLKTKEEKNLIIVGQNSAELNVFEMQK